MEDRERGAGRPPEGGLARPGADEVPDDVLAEQDAEERSARGESLVSRPVEELPHDVLTERDAEARAAEEELRRQQAGG